MAQGNNNNFLAIPSQEGFFRTVRVERSEEENTEDDEETEEDVRLIPRCSPVPRKRGPSIADETAEYMRIRLAFSNRRVSFADTTGGELVDVRMFVPFDSDEEDESRWEEEEARYQKAYSEPTYRVLPEFQALTGTELVLSVHTNKLEVESVTSVPDEPLAFEVLICVLNISFHKSVYVRSTMDGWITHFDYPAEYVQGSNDGETDRFSVKLSFAPPYLFNGARIDFVVRYDTSDGEFWANNSGKNYSITLLQSYEDVKTQPTNEENIELRGILKPPRYRANTDDDDDESYDEEDDLTNNEFESAENKTSFAQPTVVQPEIDIETAKNMSSSPQSARSFSTVGCPISTTDSLYGEPLPLESTLSYNSPQAEESETTQLSTLHESESQSTSQFSEAEVNVYNTVLSMPVPTVFVHPYDENYELKNSNKPDHQPQQDNFHPETAAQVPFEFGQHSSGGFSDAPHIQEEDDLKEKKDVDCFASEIDGTEMKVVEELSQNIGEEKTETYLHMLEPPSSTINNDQKTEDVSLTMTVHSLTEAVQHPQETRTQEQEVEFVSMLTAETSKMVEVMSTVESTRIGGEEMDGSVASCLPPCLRQDRETHSSPFCPLEDTKLIITQEEIVLEPDEDPNNGEQAILMSTSDHQTTSQETSEQASISETSSTAPDFAFDSQPSTVRSSTEEDLTCQRDERSVTALQTCKDSKTKPPLPIESSIMSAISKNETEVDLERCVTISFTFCSAAVCLAVGIQEPSIFLVVGLFLLSLCF